MKHCHFLTLCGLLLSAGLSGCGGGGSSVAETASGSTMSVGPVETRAAGGVQGPVVMQGATSSVMGVYGTTFTSTAVNLTPENQQNEVSMLSSTMIAYSLVNRPVLFDLSSYQTYQLSNSVSTYSNTCSPSWNGTGDYLAASEYDPATSAFQIFVYTSDGLSRVRVTNTAGPWSVNPSFSPVSSKIAFSRDGNIFLVGQDGSGLVQLTSGAENENMPRWNPAGTKVYYLKTVSGKTEVWSMNMDGSGQARALALSYSILGYDVDSTGTKIGALYNDGTKYNVIVAGTTGGQVTAYQTADTLTGLTFSPQGSHLAFIRIVGSSASLETVRLSDSSATVLQSGIPYWAVSDPRWSPLPRKRIFVASGSGLFGSTAAGFFVSMKGSMFKSFLAFDAITRTGVSVDPSISNGFSPSNHYATITASDSLTMLRYVNSFMTPRVTVIDPNVASTRAQGVIVTWDQTTGLVAGVAPFSRSRSGSKPTAKQEGGRVSFEGDFLAVYDAAGRKVSGASSRISLEPGTGVIKAQ